MKMFFKRVLSLLLLLTLVVVLAACGDKDDNKRKVDSPYDYKGKEILFLVNELFESDPRRSDYTGDFKKEKTERINYVEEYYNVKIKFVKFGDIAEWGPSRIQAIINGVTSQQPIGHFYQVPSMWIPQLAAANSIVPVDDFLNEIVDEEFDNNIKQMVHYQGKYYGFESGLVLYTDGLYYNLDLLNNLGLESPAKLWLRGEWTWSKLVEYAQKVKNELGSDGYYGIGGVPVDYVQHMIGANGGYLINPMTNKVAFHQSAAINVMNFLHEDLWEADLWEPKGAYDAGSADWKSGKVLFHPGTLWFNNQDNRWKGLTFQKGYVPYPMGDDISDKKDYRVPITEMTVMTISAGIKDIEAEVLFKIWNDMQHWASTERRLTNFKLRIQRAYDDDDSVEAHLDIVQRIYNEQITAISSPGRYDSNGFYTVINRAVKEGEAKSLMDAIEPIYQDGINSIHNK